MLIYALFGLVGAGVITDFSISAQNLTITAVTTYKFNLKLVTGILSTGSISIVFPSVFSGLNQGVYTCTSSQSTSCLCKISGQTLGVTSCFPLSANVIFELYLSSVNNPKIGKNSGHFQIFTYSTSGTLADSQTAGPSVTIKEGTLKRSQISIEGQVSSEATWTLNIEISQEIPAGGYIFLHTPSFASTLGKAKNSVTGLTYCTSGLACKEKLLINTNLYCECSTSGVNMTVPQAMTGSSLITLNLNSPPSTYAVFSFFVSTGLSDGVLEKSGNLSASAQSPLGITIRNFELDSSYTVSDYSNYIFGVLVSSPIPQYSYMYLNFTDDFSIDKLTSIDAFFGLSSPTMTVNGLKVLITNGFVDGYLKENTLIYFKANKVKNPYSTQPSGSISLAIFDKNNAVLASVSTGLIVTAHPGVLTSVKISPLDTYIDHSTKYTFSFQLSHSLKAGAGIYIIFPDEIIPTNYNGNCLYVADNSALSKSSQCEITNNKYLYVTGGMLNGNQSNIVNFQVGDIKNSKSSANTSPFFISTCLNDACTYLIDNYTAATLQFSPNAISSAYITIENAITGDESVYTFTILSPSTVPQKSYIELALPAGLAFNLITCTGVSGFNSNLNCLYTASILTLNLTQGFESADFNAGTFQFSVSSFTNPPSTKPVSSFKVFIKQAGNLISYKEDIQAQALYPHLLKTASVGAGNYTVGSVTSIQFDIQPFNNVKLSSLRIEQPADLSLTKASCSGDGVVSCSNIDNGKLVALDSVYRSVFSIILTGVTMPSSTKPTDSFKIYTFESNYQVDYAYTLLTLTMTVPGNFISSKLLITDPGISKTTSYTFQLKNTNPVYENGYILILFPIETSFQYPTTCLKSNSQATCSLTSEGVKIVLSATIYSSYFEITINNIINSKYAGTSSAFQITTFNQLGYKIDQSSDLAAHFSCYSPCTTCEDLPSNCKSCSNLYYYDNSCHTSCKAGYFPTGSYQCEVCVSPCLTCSSGSECTSCVENQILYTGKCIENCPDGYYEANNICEACSENCKKCDSTQCLTCSTGFIYKKKCIETCEGYTIDGTCYDCSENCQECINGLICNKCDENFILYNEKCSESCPKGSFEFNSTCESCASPCESCTSSENCVACSDLYYLISGKCQETCPSNYFPNSGLCYECSIGCENCDKNGCFQCKDEFFNYNSSCVKSCPNQITVKVDDTCQECSESCLTCSGTQNYCSSCSDPFFLFEGSCIETCPGLLVGFGNECVKCEDGCETCEGTPDQCLSCNNETVFYGGKCLDECPGNVSVQIGQVCEECTGDCIYCENLPGYCTVCKTGVEYMGSCLVTCPTGYYPISGHCIEQCSEGCTSILLNNSVCDSECNTQKCEYDSGLCTIQPTYLSSLQISETPFPSTIATVSTTGISGVSKYFVPTTSFVSGSVSMMSVTESASWVNLAYQISIVDYTHGRTLMNTNTKTKVALVLISSFLIVHFLVNFIFVLVYYFKVLARDEKLKVWSKSHKCANGIIVTMACLVNFKFIKIIVSSIFGLRICKADIDKRSTLLMPLLIMSYISIITTSVPIICILVYILSVYSSGNPVFIFALDTLITTCLSTLMMIPDLIQMHREINGENKVAPPEFLTTYEPEINKTLKIETFNVCDYHDIDKTCMDTGRSLIIPEPQKSPVNTMGISCQTSEKLFKKVEPEVQISLNLEVFKQEPYIDPDPIVFKPEPYIEPDPIIKVDLAPSINLFNFVDQGINTDDLTPVTILRPSEGPSFSFERVSFDSISPTPRLDNLKIESVGELWVHPIRIKGGENNVPVIEDAEEPQPFEFEIFDSSKEYIDEENEPQLLETINEEDELNLSQAEIDQYDFECVKVQHKASGLNVLVKKEFVNAELEDGSILNENNYGIEEVDQEDVRIGFIKRSNSEGIIKAKRHFRGSTIVDVELRGGIWLVGRTVRSENDFDFENARICGDGRTVLVTHKVSGLPFIVYKNFIGAENENAEALESDPDELIVDENDTHLGYYKERAYKRNFVGGLVSAILSNRNSPQYVPTPRLSDQTAFFESNPNSASERSDNSDLVQFNNSEFLNTFSEGFFTKPEPPISIEIQTEPNHDPNLSLSHTDSIMITPLKVQKISSVLSVGDPVPHKKFRKFKKINEEKPSNNSSKVLKPKKKGVKTKSKESSKQGTPKNSRFKVIKKSDSINSNESYKSIEAIYLQRLRPPKDQGEKVLRSTLHTPSNASNFELSIQTSLNQLNMIATSSKHIIDTITLNK